MTKRVLGLKLLMTTAVLAGCSSVANHSSSDSEKVKHAIASAKANCAPDDHLSIFKVGLEPAGGTLTLTGEVDRVESRVQVLQAVHRTGVPVKAEITVLPPARLGKKLWAISCLSVANGRENPDHKAEMGTQLLMGRAARIWQNRGRWWLVQSADSYLSWIEAGSFTRVSQEELDNWNDGPLLIVTAFEARILEKPDPDAQAVSDVVMGDLVTSVAPEYDWYQVRLPDGRRGFLEKKSAEDYKSWKATRKADAMRIEQTGRLFLGRPYLWGGNSPKGLDCSGFTKLVFLLNGIELNRNASQQARQGKAVPIDRDLTQLAKGDLLFFGFRTNRSGSNWVTHVGIYLGDKRFIQSSERVRVSSFDPTSAVFDERRARSLLAVRRILTDR